MNPFFSLHVLPPSGCSLSRFTPCHCARVDVLFPVRCPGTAAFVPLSTEQFWRTPPWERQVARSLNVCISVCVCEPLNRFHVRNEWTILSSGYLNTERDTFILLWPKYIQFTMMSRRKKTGKVDIWAMLCRSTVEVARSAGWIDMMLYSKRSRCPARSGFVFLKQIPGRLNIFLYFVIRANWHANTLSYSKCGPLLILLVG